MKKMILTLVLAMFTFVGGMAQDVFGKWKTIDDATGEAKSIVEIYKKDGKVFGKVVEILNPDKQDATCVDCPSYAKDKPIKGLVILRNLKKNKNEYDGGTILDPNTGKESGHRRSGRSDQDLPARVVRRGSRTRSRTRHDLDYVLPTRSAPTRAGRPD